MMLEMNFIRTSLLLFICKFLGQVEGSFPSATLKIDDNEFSTFELHSDSVEVVTVIPKDTEWFGFNFFPVEFDPTVLSDIFAGIPIVGDPDIAQGYIFQVLNGGTDVTARTMWASYLGLPVVGGGSLAFECSEEDHEMHNGTVCQYNDVTGRGDFMINVAGILVGQRDMVKPDIEIKEIVEHGTDNIAIHWRRSRSIPFDNEKGKFRVRYARAPLSYDGSYQMVQGLKYHGSAYRESQILTFSSSTSPGGGDRVENRLVVSDYDENEGVVFVGGESSGWRFIDTSVADGYLPVSVPVGTVVRFDYTFILNVKMVSSKADFEQCETSGASLLGNTLESPVLFTLDSPGEYFFVSDIFLDIAGMTLCESGVKIMITATNDVTRESPQATSGDSQSGYSVVLIPVLLVLLQFIGSIQARWR